MDKFIIILQQIPIKMVDKYTDIRTISRSTRIYLKGKLHLGRKNIVIDGRRFYSPGIIQLDFRPDIEEIIQSKYIVG